MKSKTLIFITLLIFSSIQLVTAQDLEIRNEPTPRSETDQPNQQEGAGRELTELEEDTLQEEDKPVEIVDSALLRASFIQNLQNPRTKRVIFEMEFTPAVNSDRVRFDWIITGDSVEIDENQLTGVLAVEAGRTYSIPIEVLPGPLGVTEVYGEVKIFGAGSDIIATVRKNYATDSASNILPITSEYSRAQTFSTIWQITQLIGGGGIAIGLGFFGFKKFVKWYKKDETLAYDQAYYGKGT